MEIARFVTTTAGTKDSLQDARATINDHFQRLLVGDECSANARLMHGRGADEGSEKERRARVEGKRNLHA